MLSSVKSVQVTGRASSRFARELFLAVNKFERRAEGFQIGCLFRNLRISSIKMSTQQCNINTIPFLNYSKTKRNVNNFGLADAWDTSQNLGNLEIRVENFVQVCIASFRIPILAVCD